MLRKFILLFTMLIMCTTAHARDTQIFQTQSGIQCLTDIGNDQETFVNAIKTQILHGQEFNQRLVDREKHKLYTIVAANIVTHCIDTNNLNDFNHDIVDATKIDIPFKLDDKYYKLTVDVETLFEYINIPAGVLVTNLRNKRPGDVITKAETPSDYISSFDCSDHWVRLDLSDSSPVNVAGKAAFPEYTDQEFFIDFPFGKNNRAFPGLIIGAKTGWGGAEQVVWYPNYRVARAKAKQFAEGLNNTACSKDNLVVDVVSLTTKPVTQGDKTGWAITAEIGGGVGTAISIAGAVAAVSGVVAATTWEVPVAGWIVAAVAATVATVSGIIAIAPSSLADMNQVMILDGPYRIK